MKLSCEDVLRLVAEGNIPRVSGSSLRLRNWTLIAPRRESYSGFVIFVLQ